jgi:hypothetical protein
VNGRISRRMRNEYLCGRLGKRETPKKDEAEWAGRPVLPQELGNERFPPFPASVPLSL